MQFKLSITLVLSYIALALGRDCKPTKNSLVKNCSSRDAIFEMKSLTLSPSTPKKGQKVNVVVVGNLKERIEKGAKFNIDIKRNGNNLLRRNEDLCDYAVKENSGYKCPINAGNITLKHSFDIPAFAPSGNYIIDGAAFTKNNKQIFDAQITTKL